VGGKVDLAKGPFTDQAPETVVAHRLEVLVGKLAAKVSVSVILVQRRSEGAGQSRVGEDMESERKTSKDVLQEFLV
jgi:hypothetical protein